MGVVTGTFQNPDGSAVANGEFQWKLSNDAILLSVAAIAPTLIRGFLDSTGNMNATLDFNDAITTSGGTNTFYQLTVKDIRGAQVWNENYYLTGTAANINLIAPGSNYAGPFFYPVINFPAPDGIVTATAMGTVLFSTLNMFYEFIAGTAGFTYTMQSAVGLAGRTLRAKKIDGAVGQVTLTAAGVETMDGQSTYVLNNQWQYVQLESDNANWFVVANN